MVSQVELWQRIDRIYALLSSRAPIREILLYSIITLALVFAVIPIAFSVVSQMARRCIALEGCGIWTLAFISGVGMFLSYTLVFGVLEVVRQNASTSDDFGDLWFAGLIVLVL